MKEIAEKIVVRDYKKRMISILTAAIVLLAAVAFLIPTTLHKQIAQFRALEEAHEKQERAETTNANLNAQHGDKEQKLKSVLRQLTPVGTGTKAAFAVVAFLALLLGIFYWITIAEWLYKTAVLNGLNRALWFMLGLLFNILVFPVLWIVLCDPKRMERQG